MRSRPLPARPLAAAYDPTAREAPARATGPEHRQPPSPYDRSLVPAAANWLRELPAVVCPRETASWFPRIINRLSRFWDSPPMIESMFDELLVDRRHGRKGFAPKIQAELRVLYAYYRTQQQTAPSLAGAEHRQAPSLYDRTLNASASKWLRELPAAICPREAAARFPRIINRLARFWDTPAMATDIFDELLIERRPGRKGFPPEVLAEFRALQDYCRTARPARTGDVWSSVPDRGSKRRT